MTDQKYPDHIAVNPIYRAPQSRERAAECARGHLRAVGRPEQDSVSIAGPPDRDTAGELSAMIEQLTTEELAALSARITGLAEMRRNTCKSSE